MNQLISSSFGTYMTSCQKCPQIEDMEVIKVSTDRGHGGHQMKHDRMFSWNEYCIDNVAVKGDNYLTSVCQSYL